MDLEVKIKEEPVLHEGTETTSLENVEHLSEMIPLKQEIKSESTETGSTQENSFEMYAKSNPNFPQENVEHLSEMIPVKQETKSELTEPGSTQENTLEPSADIKEEVFIEQRAVHQLVPLIKGENKMFGMK
ncbi:uncharacterized protein [Anabrus simplex]|uniref:uncharacterized protein n=1 Tax=Anabrus simplex TaxID=316456 RepID=UPI0035A2AF5E